MHAFAPGDKPATRRIRASGLSQMSDILFIKTSSLGDVIHHMPALTEARRRRPDARFFWVVEEAFAPLVRLHPAVSGVIPVASRRWRAALLAPSTWREIASFWRAMRARRYDDVIDTQGLRPLGADCAARARPPPRLRRGQRPRARRVVVLRRAASASRATCMPSRAIAC